MEAKKLPAHPARVILKDVYRFSYILFVLLFRFLTALFLALPVFLSCDQFLFTTNYISYCRIGTSRNAF